MKIVNPENVVKPASNYAQAVVHAGRDPRSQDVLARAGRGACKPRDARRKAPRYAAE